MIRSQTLEEVLSGLSEDDWRKWVFMRTDGTPWSGSVCYAVDTGAEEPGADGETPRVLDGLGVSEFLSIQDLLSVRENLRQQKPDFDIFDLVAASVHYHVRDAFVVLNGEMRP